MSSSTSASRVLRFLLAPIAAAALLGGAITASAQSQPAASSTASSEPVVALSPFEVTTTHDYGYQAQNTLSGSRLNTSLNDTAAPISVFTKDFLADIGATNLGDIAEWAVGSKIYYNEDEGNQNGYISSPTRINVRGQPASMGRNYYQWALGMDTYNVDRLELSSGPNSILFGIGSPGGIFNAQTKRALTDRNLAAFEGRVDSNGSVRGALDVNRIVLKDRLALRLNIMREEGRTWRKWERDDGIRKDLTATWRPFENSKFRAEYEVGDRDEIRGRTYPAIYGGQAWLLARAAGETAPLQAGWIAEPYAANGSGNNGTFTRYNGATALARTMTQYTTARLVYDFATDQLTNLQGSTTTRPPNGRVVSFNDPFVPITTVLTGPTVNRIEKSKALTLTWEQHLARNLDLELGYNRQRSRNGTNDWQQTSDTLFVDTNSRLPNGSVNPNAGRAYIESAPVHSATPEDYDTYRVLASYSLDLTKRNWWLGSHQFAAQYEGSHIEKEFTNKKLVLIDRVGAGLNATAAENDANRPWFRGYIDLNDPNTFYWPGYKEFTNTVITQGSLNGRAITTEWVNQPASASVIDRLNSGMAVMRNSWFDNRLITAVGVRRENDVQTNRQTMRNAEGENVFGPADPNLNIWNTATTYSAVLHFDKAGKYSGFYNRGSNFRTPAIAQNVLGLSRPPLGTAVSEDYGIKFNLFDGKLSGSVLRYVTKGKNFSSNAGVITQDSVNRIWDALAAARLITPQEAVNNYVLQNAVIYDQNSEGYELSLVANPTRGWRMMMNASQNETVSSGAGDEVQNYLNQYGPVLFQNPNLITSSGLTIAQERSVNIDPDFTLNYRDVNGVAPRGRSKYSANLRANYTFTNGRLKGAFAGGGVQWRSAPVVGVTAGSYGDPSRRTLFGKAYDTEFLNFGYAGKFRAGQKDLRYRLQLNIDNVFQERGDFTITQVDATNTPIQFRFREPRLFSLTTTVEF